MRPAAGLHRQGLCLSDRQVDSSVPALYASCTLAPSNGELWRVLLPTTSIDTLLSTKSIVHRCVPNTINICPVQEAPLQLCTQLGLVDSNNATLMCRGPQDNMHRMRSSLLSRQPVLIHHAAQSTLL